MHSRSVSTMIHRLSIRAHSFPASSRIRVSRFIEPFLHGSQAVRKVSFSARRGIRVICAACLPTRNAVWCALKKASSMP